MRCRRCCLASTESASSTRGAPPGVPAQNTHAALLPHPRGPFRKPDSDPASLPAVAAQSPGAPGDEPGICRDLASIGMAAWMKGPVESSPGSSIRRSPIGCRYVPKSRLAAARSGSPMIRKMASRSAAFSVSRSASCRARMMGGHFIDRRSLVCRGKLHSLRAPQALDLPAGLRALRQRSGMENRETPLPATPGWSCRTRWRVFSTIWQERQVDQTSAIRLPNRNSRAIGRTSPTSSISGLPLQAEPSAGFAFRRDGQEMLPAAPPLPAGIVRSLAGTTPTNRPLPASKYKNFINSIVVFTALFVHNIIAVRAIGPVAPRAGRSTPWTWRGTGRHARIQENSHGTVSPRRAESQDR